MLLSYHNLNIDIQLDGIICIEAVHIVQKLNEHGRAEIKALTDEEKVVGLVEQADSGLAVHISRNDDKKQTLFKGRAERIRAVKENGLYYLHMEFYGYSREWDLTDKSQSFCKGNDTYARVIRKVLSEYASKEIKDEASGGAKIPGMLMQYEETDWVFLKRLASHFSAFLAADNTQDYGKVYFGIPRMDFGTVLKDEEYTVLQGKERYEKLEDAGDIMSQEMMGWRIRSRVPMQFCEQVMLGHIETVVTSVDIYTEKGELIFEYELSRRKGIITGKKKNPRIYGMSIPATVKERKGNQIRVHFDIDPSYEPSDDLKYFTYAIETSNFYCMPEVGSRVHIYFPEHDEQSAMAVHAISGGASSGGSSGSGGSSSGSSSSSGGSGGSSSGGSPSSGGSGGGQGSAGSGGSSTGGALAAAAVGAAGKEAPPAKKAPQKDPAYKKFSDPSGSYMELAPYGITFSPGSGSVAMTLEKSGMLSLKGKNLNFTADTTLYAGVGAEGSIPEVYVTAKKELKLTLSNGDSEISMAEETDIIAAFIKKDAELKKPAEPLASEMESQLTAGDEDLRSEYNAGALDTLTQLAQKRAEGKRKIREGIFSILTVVASVAIVVATGGAAAPLVAAMAVTGGFKAVSAVSDIAEGISDVNKANKGDLSQSYNFMRDSVFQGNEMLYEAAKGVNDMVFGFVTGKAVKFNLTSGKANKVLKLIKNGKQLCDKNKKLNYALNIGGDVLTGCIDDYIQNGSINPMNVACNVGSGMLKGWGMNKLQFGSGSKLFNNKYTRKATNVIIGTAVGTGVDYGKSKLLGEEFDLKSSLVQNGIVSTIGQVFGEPIDAVTGAYLITSSDFILPDILEPVLLTRSYRSTERKCGYLGKGWIFSYEGRLCRDGEVLHVQLPDGYCTAFVQSGESFKETAGNGRHALRYETVTGEWILTDLHRHIRYCYGTEGLLQSVTDRNGLALTLTYEDGYLNRLTTTLGYAISFRFAGGRLIGIEDEENRCIKYCYEGEFLKEVVHMDGGVTRYEYSEDGYLVRPTDQTGLCYLENHYDEAGRVTLQTLANGDTYRAVYKEKERETHVEYSAYPGVKVYTYNEAVEVTQIRYPDGSHEQYAYDGRHNRIRETNRMGSTIEKAYDAQGHLVKEKRPGGLVKEYHYEDRGNLVCIRDNGGRETRLGYDGNHNLISRREKVSAGHWIEKNYRYDRMGRLIEETDGEGHTTSYRYGEGSAYPCRTLYADGSELFAEYDRNGRKLLEKDDTGRTEYGYNRNGYLTMQRDGEGNESHWLYDGMGRMLAFYTPKQWKAADGRRTEYRYDFLNRLTDTIYADGSHEMQQRDGEGNILKKVHPDAYDGKTKDGAGICYEYDLYGNLLRIRYADGGVERMFYDGAGNCIKHVLPEEYREEADDGPGCTYTYDEEGRLLCVMKPEGCQESAYEYDLWGNCVLESDGDGHVTRYSYDLLGRLLQKLTPYGEDGDDIRYSRISYAYDANGNCIKETRHGGSYGEDGTELIGKDIPSGEALTLSFFYDARNRLSRVEDGLGARASYRYDTRGNRVREERKVNDGISHRIRYGYDLSGRLTEKTEYLDSGLAGEKEPETAVTRYGYDENGNRTLILTPEGYRISRAYDERDRLIMERVEDKGNGTDRSTYLTYDRAGNVTGVRQQGADGRLREISYDYDLKDRLTKAEELEGPVFLASYDGNDRISEEKRLLPAGGEAYGKMLCRYDLYGNLTERVNGEGQSVEKNRYDARGNLTEVCDGDGVKTGYRYGVRDELRRIVTAGSLVQGKALRTLSYNPRGQVTEAEDGMGGRVAYGLDGWGRITSVRTAEGGTESYGYDYAGNLTRSVDAEGNETVYAYNSRGNLCRITGPDGKSLLFAYDKEGRLKTRTDRNGTVTEYRYNVDGLPVLQACTDQKGNRQVMGAWEYNSLGQLKKSVGGGRCYTYEYRPDGKLLEKRENGRLLLSCEYFRNGSIKRLKDVTGKGTLYEYDGQGRLSRLLEEDGKELAGYEYTAAGRLSAVRTASGVCASYRYDGEGNLIHLAIGEAGSTSGKLYDMSLGYDLNGNRTERKGMRLGPDGRMQEVETRYHYDLMGRLTEEDRKGDGERYAYDRNGNRIRKETVRGGIIDRTETYCYNERNQLTELGSGDSVSVYLYDPEGNLVAEKNGEKESIYSYDLLNRQTGLVTMDGKVQENRYDGEGLRTGTVENGKQYTFLYHNGELLAECDGEGAPVRRYVRGNGLGHIQTLDDSRYHTCHRDEQGSTAYLTGTDGSIENSYLYDAFGNGLESREVLFNRIRYTGQQYDRETGQYYLRARYYNSRTGRFTQEDTYRGDGLNLYAYCGNNPVVYYDPSGHEAQKPACGGENPNSQDKTEVDRVASGGAETSPKTRLPRTNGEWSGEPGNGKWYSNKPEVNKVTGGTGVEFKNGRPDFSPWSKGDLNFKPGQLNGTSNDFSLVYEKIQQQYNLPSKNAAKQLLKDIGVTPHHASPTKIELIPSALHGNIPHIGSAADMRG